MSNVSYIPEGVHTVTPYFLVPDGEAFMDFLKRVFDAEPGFVSKDPGGRIMHAEMKIGDSRIELGEGNSQWPAMKLNLHVYVPDSDEVYRRAMAAGAKSLREVRDEFYGDRTGGVEDPAGNIWWIATHKEDVTPEEMDRRMAAMKGA